jgi:cytochrome c-type biogenesis protein CcmH/NrfG
MAKNDEAENTDYVKKGTMVGAVVLSLCIGFICGAVFSSYKLAGTGQGAQQGSTSVNNNSQGAQQDNSAQFASQILQVEQYLQQNPKDAKAWAQLGNLCFDSGQFKNAIEAYTKSLAIEPGKVGIITDLGVMYRRNKEPLKAIEKFDEAIAIDPTFETARFNKGIVLLHDLNDAEKGIKAWEEIVNINPLALAPNGESVDSLVQKMKNKQ